MLKVSLKAVVASATGSGVVVAKCQLRQVQKVALIVAQNSAFAEERLSPPIGELCVNMQLTVSHLN